MSSFATHFTHAISRKPAQSITEGLRAEDVGNPDYDLFVQHHDAYVMALENAGARVTVLEALEEFPDCVFVEDTALCLPEGAIVMRPGAPSRLGEAAAMAPNLKTFFDDIRVIEQGHIEGGDILVTAKEILVGKSARSDNAGIEALRQVVSDWGYQVRALQTPPEVLHFKTDCGLLDDTTILSTHRLAASGCFEGYKIIETAAGEEAAANAIRFNDVVIMPKGFDETANRVRQAGFDVVEIPNTEAAKVDGGMSCLSLRLNPSKSA
ncbi:dimethylarginine dimethylaminohydrolase [Sneathiella sp. P13V-1]|uniref:dimethylarginine dimethylaminohydrolase family protein n=1 Tax=Sneathiella sp. P13V-1 TaxID=2697366 RepID=UPI00187B1C02|nr:arginine deiminase family protein [Sneathiella sp. P13V-1]MBE7637454.1 dimethylarginine dimethylaminohydrolase [Sneathiella sp. P13V-1]